ncbi:MAG: GNAT family N-acetyltransferase [Candidatus Hermodarchaeota archaeon]
MLEGERIRLRTIENSDLPILREFYNDFRLRGAYGGGYNPLPAEQYKTERFLDRLSEKVLVLAIILKETEELLGTVDYRSEEFNSGRLGIIIGKEKYRKKGYGTEAMHLIMKICFLERNFQKLFLWTRGWNISAQKLAESLGFKEAVRIRNAVLRDGKWYDAICYDLLREEYLEGTIHD